ncbi:ATP-binding protein [Streptomyces sp. NPDC047000]|uniref:ATP-binding protein n=1 Tax=Streptomyces sp. NPDC047000 TaxID=3155474 RepID=UPI0033DB0754
MYVLWIAYSLWPNGPLGGPLGWVAHWLDSHDLQTALSAIGFSSTTVVAAVVFLIWRFRRTRHYYLRKAKRHPDELVRPGTIIGDVVGRDKLCDALMNNLQDSENRRPHVIVGAIGVGKTALLVRLTQRLAGKGVVPVALQLRDVEINEEFNFTELAKRQFCSEVLDRVYAMAEAEKVWQRLRYTQDRVVVLADGLEDALKRTRDRDSKIRKAIDDAREAGLPLVITSRPQKSLEAINAAQTVLEPLSEEAALEYVAGGSNWRSDKQRMDWVVEAAGIAESPLYLNIAKDLERRDLLEPLVGGGQDENCDPRDQDAWVLRYDLLDAWVDALVDGHLYPEQPLSYYGRRRTVEYLSALACAALHTNSTYVRYGALTEKTPTQVRESAKDRNLVVETLTKWLTSLQDRAGNRDGAVRYPAVDNGEADADPARDIDERLAGSWGARLGLVEEGEDGVRFHHSVLQAFLASRCMDAFVRPKAGSGRRRKSESLAVVSSQTSLAWVETLIDSTLTSGESAEFVTDAYFNHALGCPGRELAMALVFYTRSLDALSGCQARNGPSVHSPDGRCPIGIVRKRLLEAAARALKEISAVGTADENSAEEHGDIEQDPKIRALELYSAALDVDSFHHRPQHREIVGEICVGWGKLQAYNDRKLDDPKKALIKRIGATGRLLSRRQALPASRENQVENATAYDVLFDMAGKEPSHGVRFAMAQAIGDDGNAAFLALKDRLSPDMVGLSSSCRSEMKLTSARASVDDLLDAVSFSFGYRTARGGVGSPPSEMPVREGPIDAPGTTRTERLLRKSRSAVLVDRRHDEERAEKTERKTGEVERRKDVMRAWLAPLLVQSCSFTRHEDTPYELLTQWMQWITTRGFDDLELQVALAQGFRQAANHRTLPTKPARARNFLNEQAWEMLKHTHYWAARLALLHALTLWALPDDVTQAQPRYGHGASPAKQVRQWLEHTADPKIKRKIRHEHPLVRAAGKLACQALQTRRPDRFLWIDEAGTASQIGSKTSSPREWRMHNLWIPPSRGWSTLDPRAQQLLGDVLVLLILTEERGDRPEDALNRLKHAYPNERTQLPPCMARDRTPLNPMQALVVDVPLSLPGSNCADNCLFEFCPYPPKGPQCRTELNELFCIHQRSMLDKLQFQAWRSLRFRRRPPWQRKTSVPNLRRFWDEMGARARNRSLKDVSQRRTR